MESRRSVWAILFVAALVVFVASAPALAQTGKLHIRVTPKQAYIYIDGHAEGEGACHVPLSPGEHQVGVYNYGYKPHTRTVTIEAGKVTSIEVNLEPIPGTASAPWGRIQIEGAPHAAVLLNGKTPDYLVGHSDEFDHDIIWKQELLVPPGTHQLTVTHKGSEIWSGTVTVAANQRVIVHAGKGGQQRTTDWPRGTKLGSQARFKAGIASATVAVLPVTGSFSAQPTQINCGESSRLSWSSSETVHAEISGLGDVGTSGERSVSPHQTTEYKFAASGPGGMFSSSATVNVNTVVQASLNLSPAEIRYYRVGDKVIEHGSAQLSWTTSNADSISITPFGSVSASGNRTVQPEPQKKDPGPVDEAVTYTLKATNVCGGSATRTVTLRIKGTICIPPKVALRSIFFPTDYPEKRYPEVGLLRSQQQALSEIAAAIKDYLACDPNARLELGGSANADRRGSDKYNLALSERRAAAVKKFLVSKGISASSIVIAAVGERQNLTKEAVAQLEKENPNKPARAVNRQAAWLAHNRRVDMALKTLGQESLRYYPYNVDDWKVLWQRPKPSRRAVKKVQ